MATDFCIAIGYTAGMARRPTYPTPPATGMNQWVRDALAASDMTQQALADALTASVGLGSYAKSMVNKMTKARKVSMDEARAISAITGYPLPASADDEDLAAQIRNLDPADQQMVRSLIDRLHAQKISSSPE